MGWAFVEPDDERLNYICSIMPDASLLDDAVKMEFEKAMGFVLGNFDTNVRTVTKGLINDVGQNHYFAIRALNTPSTPFGSYYKRNAQLVGQEYFGINRFFPSFLDIADIQWWAIFEDGDWQLHTWNTHGEHLATGNSGMGRFKTGYIKVNGAHLGPEDVISFMNSFKRRAEGNFIRYYDPKTIDYTLSQLEKGQQPIERRLRQLRELNLIDENNEHTYILRSRYTEQKAEDRCHQDLTLNDLRKGYRKLPNATDLGVHGNTSDIKEFYKQNDIEALISTKNPSFDDVQKFLELEREAYLKFGFSLSDIHLLEWPGLLDYSTLGASNNVPKQQGIVDKLKKAIGI
jgi:hypothetical protein